MRGWLAEGIEPHAIGVAPGQPTWPCRHGNAGSGRNPDRLTGAKGKKNAVRAGTMHGMKGLEFQAIAAIGVAEGMVPAPRR